MTGFHHAFFRGQPRAAYAQATSGFWRPEIRLLQPVDDGITSAAVLETGPAIEIPQKLVDQWLNVSAWTVSWVYASDYTSEVSYSLEIPTGALGDLETSAITETKSRKEVYRTQSPKTRAEWSKTQTIGTPSVDERQLTETLELSIDHATFCHYDEDKWSIGFSFDIRAVAVGLLNSDDVKISGALDGAEELASYFSEPIYGKTFWNDINATLTLSVEPADYWSAWW